MHALLRLLFFPMILVVTSLAGQHTSFETVGEPVWLMYDGDRFSRFESGEGVRVVYFRIAAAHPAAEYLRLNSAEPFTLFVNNKLDFRGNSRLLRLDSLASALGSSSFTLAVYKDVLNKRTLIAEYVTKEQVAPSADIIEERPSYALRDFSVIGALLLAIMIVVVVRLNPKLASDYFSLGRIFSFREDESHVYTRFASSTNILFYVFCSLLLGYFLLITFQFLPSDYNVSTAFIASSFGEILLNWIKLSGIILIILIGKILFVFLFSALFGIGEFGGVHFFNWVRLLIVFFGAVTFALFVYYISHGNEAFVYATFLKLVAWLIGGWMLLIFLKLVTSANGSMFHLFSYICATELIPFLFMVKVLYN